MLFTPREPIQEEVVAPPVVDEVVEPVVTEEQQESESPAAVIEEEILPAPVDEAPIEAPQPAPSAAVTVPVEEDPFVDQEAHPRMLVWVFVALGIDVRDPFAGKFAGYSDGFLSLHLSPLYTARAGDEG